MKQTSSGNVLHFATRNMTAFTGNVSERGDDNAGGNGMPPDLNERVAKLETMADHTTRSLDRIERGIEALSAKADSGRDQFHDLRVEVAKQGGRLPTRTEFWIGLVTLLGVLIALVGFLWDSSRLLSS